MTNSKTSHGAIDSLVAAIKSNYAAITELQNKAAGADINEVAQMCLMDVLGYTQIQAEEVVEQLKKGLDNYSSQRKALEENPSSMQDKIISNLASYSEQERMEILVNILTAFQLTDSANADKDIATLRSANAVLSEEELTASIINSLGSLPFTSIVETVGKELDPDTLAALADMRNMATEEYRLSAAVQLYIAQQQGALNADKDTVALSPEVLGAMTGASIDAINASTDLSEGRIDLTTWQRILKYILGALFLVTLCAIAAIALMAINLGLFTLVMSIFGMGTLGTIIAVILMFAVCVKACQLQDQALDFIMEKMSTLYNKAITKLTDLAKRLRDKIATLAGKKATNEAENSKVDTDSHTDTESVETDGTPALA